MRYILFLCIFLSGIPGFTNDFDTPMDNPFDTRFTLPQGKEVKVEGTTLQCFTAPEYLTLVRMDAAYGSLYDWRLETLGEIKGFKLTIGSRDKTIFELKDIIKTHEKNREWLTLRLKQSGEMITGQASGFRLEKYALWTVALLEAVTIAVLSFRK